MIRTVVCAREKCNGNSFFIKASENNILATCKECDELYKFNIGNCDFTMLSSCSKCNNDTFKLFKDMEHNTMIVKCTSCGNPPERIYIDSEGNHVSYESKKISDMKEIVEILEQRIYNIERKMDSLREGQELLEESIAYVNKFLSNHS